MTKAPAAMVDPANDGNNPSELVNQMKMSEDTPTHRTRRSYAVIQMLNDAGGDISTIANQKSFGNQNVPYAIMVANSNPNTATAAMAAAANRPVPPSIQGRSLPPKPPPKVSCEKRERESES